MSFNTLPVSIWPWVSAVREASTDAVDEIGFRVCGVLETTSEKDISIRRRTLSDLTRLWFWFCFWLWLWLWLCAQFTQGRRTDGLQSRSCRLRLARPSVRASWRLNLLYLLIILAPVSQSVSWMIIWSLLSLFLPPWGSDFRRGTAAVFVRLKRCAFMLCDTSSPPRQFSSFPMTGVIKRNDISSLMCIKERISGCFFLSENGYSTIFTFHPIQKQLKSKIRTLSCVKKIQTRNHAVQNEHTHTKLHSVSQWGGDISQRQRKRRQYKVLSYYCTMLDCSRSVNKKSTKINRKNLSPRVRLKKWDKAWVNCSVKRSWTDGRPPPTGPRRLPSAPSPDPMIWLWRGKILSPLAADIDLAPRM